MGMITTNERVVGDTKFVMISHVDLTAPIVPLKSRKSLVVAFTAFQDVDGLTKKVLEYSTRAS